MLNGQNASSGERDSRRRAARIADHGDAAVNAPHHGGTELDGQDEVLRRREGNGRTSACHRVACSAQGYLRDRNARIACIRNGYILRGRRSVLCYVAEAQSGRADAKSEGSGDSRAGKTDRGRRSWRVAHNRDVAGYCANRGGLKGDGDG